MKYSGIEEESKEGLECFSKETWYAVFKTRRQREIAKNATITLHKRDFQLVSTDIERTKYTWVRIFSYILDQTMQHYGELTYLTDNVDGCLGN
jgi:hypothetical protein